MPPTDPLLAAEPAGIADVVRDLEAQGYIAQLGARPAGLVMCFACRQASHARGVGLEALHRLEGVSDPSEQVLVAAVRCPRCQVRGTLVLTYGPEAPAEDAEVMRLLEDRRKGRPYGGPPPPRPAAGPAARRQPYRAGPR